MNGIDTLEPRRLMAAADPYAPPTIAVSASGTLIVEGSSRRESIVVHYRPSGRIAVDVTRFGAGDATYVYSASFKRGDVDRLSIFAGAGNDRVLVALPDLRGRSTISGGRGNDRIETNGQSTTLRGDRGNDELISDRQPHFERLLASGDSVANDDGTFGHLANVFEASYNVLDGGADDDTLATYGGEDTLRGGSGNDAFRPLSSNLERTEGTTLPTLPFITDQNVAAARAATAEIELASVNLGPVSADVLWNSLRPSSFTPLETSGPGD